MARFEVVLAVVAFLLGVTSASNVTECHVCQSPRDSHCDDPYDPVLGKSARCSEITRSIALLTEVMNEERTTNANTTFVCVKLDVSYGNSTDGVVRGCFREVDNADTCRLLEAEIKNATINECNVCREDKCNSGTYLQVSAVLVGAIMFLTSKI